MTGAGERIESQGLAQSIDDRSVLRERIYGCLLGGAVGDALGAPVEFLTSFGEIHRRYGPDGLTDYDSAYGRCGAITDDTQMTLFTAEGLIRADNRYRNRGLCSMPHVVHHAYLRWLVTQNGRVPGEDKDSILTGWLFTQPALHHRRAPGNTCLSALQSGRIGSIDEPINNSKGCGGVMRIAPVGLVCNDPFGDGADLAAITHGHPSGYLAAGAFALIISLLFRGKTLPRAIQAARAKLRRRAGYEETLAGIERAVVLAAERPPSAETVAELGEGWVAEEALAIALYCALVAPDFRTGVLLAVNHPGDSDSTGLLAGQLLGVKHGLAAIPTHWLDQLEGREIITQIADDLVRHFVDPRTDSSEDEDHDRYPPW